MFWFVQNGKDADDIYREPMDPIVTHRQVMSVAHGVIDGHLRDEL